MGNLINLNLGTSRHRLGAMNDISVVGLMMKSKRGVINCGTIHQPSQVEEEETKKKKKMKSRNTRKNMRMFSVSPGGDAEHGGDEEGGCS